MNTAINSVLTLLKDPFTKDCVTEIHLHAYAASLFHGERFVAAVHFKNGDTEGRQRLEAENFSALGKKVDAFINGLEER